MRLLGKPAIEAVPARASVRGYKPWGILAYALLNDEPPTRERLASLLFADANDPMGALRWNMAELRRALGDAVSITGDPLRVVPASDVVIDVVELRQGRWWPTNDLPGQLLESCPFDRCAAFETWLLVTRRYLAGLIESVLTDAVQTALATGRLAAAVSAAGQLVELNVLDERHHALLVTCLARSGDRAGAERQLARAVRLLRDELGVEPSASLRASAATNTAAAAVSTAGIHAKIDAGRAAIAAGAMDAAMLCLQGAVADAEHTDDLALQARALTTLGASLVRIGTSFPEAEPALRRGLVLAGQSGASSSMVVAWRELGFLLAQAGHHRQAEEALVNATEHAHDDDSQLASIRAIQAMSLSDRAYYPEATALLTEAIDRARRCGRIRKAAWALAMLGRVHLLVGSLAAAAESLDEACRLARLERWSAFLPWPECLRSEVEIGLDRVDAAMGELPYANALAEHLHDRGLQALGQRALALVARHQGQSVAAMAYIDTARRLAFRGSPSYVWIQAQVAATRAELLAAHDVRSAPAAVDEWIDLAATAGLRDHMVRAQRFLPGHTTPHTPNRQARINPTWEVWR